MYAARVFLIMHFPLYQNNYLLWNVAWLDIIIMTDFDSGLQANRLGIIENHIESNESEKKKFKSF